ncbi:ATP-dependent DNA helicase PIF1 [Stylophora pistillata]|uniref:ATP-dependent DNA helicase n=1 Tax=Stylophora pistillata TaxID=50429 RepID=A0A2B4RIN9_STYPI|nr:ATP-dependent DNA helicase PIF1 [Stylophora pistillata]
MIFHAVFLVYCNDFSAVFRAQLNEDQQAIVDFAAEGHNLLITGQTEVGKSEVVKQIIRTLNARRRNVGIVRSSGIACQVYGKGLASTVHSFYGFMTADLPWRQLIDRSIGNSPVNACVKAINVIMWEEASMSSQKMFELLNLMHHELADRPIDQTLLFAGKQIILVGEFSQSQPVANMFDEGCYMFESALFDIAISHRFALTKLMRQSEEDQRFLKALAEIRLGNCSIESEEYLCSLKRNLPELLEQSATHISFCKIPVATMNRRKLDQISGDLFLYQASYDNESSRSMSWPGVPVLQLKRGCKVMLIWNKSDYLKNGSEGVFTVVQGDDLQVFILAYAVFNGKFFSNDFDKWVAKVQTRVGMKVMQEGRIPKDIFNFILSQIRNDLERQTIKEDPISLGCRLAICFYRLGRGNCHYTIAEMVGLLVLAVQEIVTQVCELIIDCIWQECVMRPMLSNEQDFKDSVKEMDNGGIFPSVEL